MGAVRNLRRNPGLRAFRVHAALKHMDLDLSLATCGRMLAPNSKLYGLGTCEVSRTRDLSPPPDGAGTGRSAYDTRRPQARRQNLPRLLLGETTDEDREIALR